MKTTKKPFFHLLGLAVLDIYILLPLCDGKKISPREVQPYLMRNMLAHCGQQPWYRDHEVGQQVLSVQSINWTVVAVSIGLCHLIDCGAVYIRLAG
jgi:hypothetical protein